MTYSLIIPIFNEEQNIENLINILNNSFLIKDNNCINIILVNDGSIDNSEYLIKSKINNNDKILLLSHRQNIGYGAAIKTGIKYSKNLANYVVFADSDLTNPIEDIKKMNPNNITFEIFKFDFPIQTIRTDQESAIESSVFQDFIKNYWNFT